MTESLFIQRCVNRNTEPKTDHKVIMYSSHRKKNTQETEHTLNIINISNKNIKNTFALVLGYN